MINQLKPIRTVAIWLILLLLLSSCANNTAGQKPVTNQNDVYNASILLDCTALLSNTQNLSPEKIELVPDDGILFFDETATFTEGETAFDLLKKVTRENNLHMDFSTMPGSQFVYVAAISNIYEGDCGDLSGWLYTINGESLPVSCDQYQLSDGDAVAFVYTCDGGVDIGLWDFE